VVKLDDPQTWNMYAYVRNNPTNLTDPTGLQQSAPVALTCSQMANDCKNGLLPAAESPNKLGPGKADPTHKQPATQKENTVTVQVNEVHSSLPGNHATIQIGKDPPVGLEPNSNAQAAAGAAKEAADAAKGTPTPHPVPGHIENQPGRRVIDDAIIHASPGQAQAMRAKLDEMRHDPSETTYSYGYHNCTSLPEELLRAGGLAAPNDITPHGLVEDLKQMYPQ